MTQQIWIACIFFLLGGGAVLLAGGCCWALWARRGKDLERSIEVQRQQLEEQNQRLAELRRLRHDVPHHAAALRGLAQKGDLAAIEDYLSSFSPLSLEEGGPLCANPVVDALARQYLGAARAAGVAVDARLEVGENAGVSAPDLCIVFGNCLENAVEAARHTQAGEPFLRLRAKDAPGWLSLVMENSCPPGGLRRVEKGYLSGKARDRVGIGLMSIRSVAERYGGTATFVMEDGRFKTAVILFKRDETR